MKTKRVVDEELLKAVRGMNCLACHPKPQTQPTEAHHVKTRKTGGDDSYQNVMPLCRAHHSETHVTGMLAFAKRYPVIGKWLEIAGWRFDETRKKWVRDQAEAE